MVYGRGYPCAGAGFYKVRDNFDKTVLTLNRLGLGANPEGIRIRNALDWLCGQGGASQACGVFTCPGVRLVAYWVSRRGSAPRLG